MSYKESVAKNLIRPFKAGDRQIKKQRELAHRDLKVARAMIGINNDWTYNIAYNAILQVRIEYPGSLIMKEIADHLQVYYSTVGRAGKKVEAGMHYYKT